MDPRQTQLFPVTIAELFGNLGRQDVVMIVPKANYAFLEFTQVEDGETCFFTASDDEHVVALATEAGLKQLKQRQLKELRALCRRLVAEIRRVRNLMLATLNNMIEWLQLREAEQRLNIELLVVKDRLADLAAAA